MGEISAIEWTDATFNPWIGCTKVSPACDHCYAEALMDKRHGRVEWGGDRVRTSAGNWQQPRRWQRQASAFFAENGRRRRVFCASLADVFDNEVPSEWRRDLFKLIEDTPDLVWLLLTKRIGNVVKMTDPARGNMPLPANAAVGATFCNQEEWDRDGWKLHDAKERTGALFSFGSFEPLLGPIVLGNRHPDWVIVGGESGHGARPMDPAWVRPIRNECVEAGTAFLFKQWGDWGEADAFPSEVQEDYDVRGLTSGKSIRVGKKAAGRFIDGVTHDGFPAHSTNIEVVEVQPASDALSDRRVG